MVPFFSLLLVVCSFGVVRPSVSETSLTDPATFRVCTTGQPRRVDPARAYDAASGELIFNVYETLISFSDKPVLPSATTNVSEWGYSDLSKFEPMLADALPTTSEDRLNWTFTVRSGVKFHPWRAANGTLITDQELTAEDVEYTFKRMLVQDQSGGPSWIFCQPATGHMFFDALDPDPATNGFDSNEEKVATLIDNFVSVSGNNVTFRWVQQRADNALMQIFAETWGCIVNKAFCIEHGCWDGSFAPGWSANFRRMPSNAYSPIDVYYNRSRYDADAAGPNTGTLGDVPAMCGTGPYAFTSWDKTTLTWTIDKFPNYWKGWAGKHVDTVIEKGVAAWPTRKMLFLSGEADRIAVPENNMFDLLPFYVPPLNESDPYTTLPGIALYYSAPTLSDTIVRFNYAVNADSPYVPKIGGVLRPDFFDDVHLRRAFAHIFNHTQYMHDALFGEAIQPTSWWVKGLAPNYENKMLTPYAMNLTKVEEEFKAGNVWDSGFEISLVYYDSVRGRIAMEMIAEQLVLLNQKRSGLPPFSANVVVFDYSTFLDYLGWHYLPTEWFGWTADFADPDNFVRPFMYDERTPVHNQTVNDLIDLALSLPEGAGRNHTYQTLQFMYWSDAWGIPMKQDVGRIWFRDWVKGFYYNQLYPGLHFYDLYKELPQPMEPVDLSVTGGIEPPTPPLPIVYVFHNQMRIGNGSSGLATMLYNISVTYKPGGAVALLYVSLGLKRSCPGLDSQFPDCTHAILSPGETVGKSFRWAEDGYSQTIAGNTTGVPWTVSGESYPINSNAQDDNTGDNTASGGTVIAKTLTGEITGNGIVDIFDAIRLASAYGSITGQKRWNLDADIKPDGVIDIFDAIILAGNFNNHVP